MDPFNTITERLVPDLMEKRGPERLLNWLSSEGGLLFTGSGLEGNGVKSKAHALF